MISVSRILCPTDFSPLSRRALDHAVALARWYEADVTVLHVPPSAPMPASEVAYVPPAEPAPEVRERLRTELHGFVEPARRAGICVRLELGQGDVAREVVARTEKGEADLVVVGTHGRHGLERLVLGSVTERVLRHAACPVLTVSPRVVGEPSARFETVLCPVDLSPSSAHTVREAAAVAEEAQARLVLLHVIAGPSYPPMRVPPGFDSRAYREDVTAAVSGRLWRLLPEGGGAAEVAVVWGSPHPEIVHQARGRKAGLVVMGAHGGPLGSTLFGSTAHSVVRTAPCPVLVIRARAHGFAAAEPEPVAAMTVAD
ncbi:MAG TPA: universal stress protein [Vicinamibacteria bacterium]|nr:universal stress protein [Vicinamibacteria bacterium]